MSIDYNNMRRRDLLSILFGKGEGTPAPMTNLQVLHTYKTPVHITNLNRDQSSFVGRKGFGPEYDPSWMELSGQPLDIIANPRPAPELAEGFEETYGDLDGKIPWTVEVPHMTGFYPTRPQAVIGYGSLDNCENFSCIDRIEKKPLDTIATHAFTDKPKIYSAKMYNIMTSMICAMEWQQEHGPFTPYYNNPDPYKNPKPNAYSIIDMMGASQREVDRYLIGIKLRGGGMCAFVTTLSKMMYTASHTGVVEILSRTMHHEEFRYAENSLEPGITIKNSDATVGFVPDSPELNPANTDYEFRFLNGEYYLSCTAYTQNDASPLSKNITARHICHPPDARMLFTVSLVKHNPAKAKHPITGLNEIEQLYKARDDYANFHNFADGNPCGYEKNTRR